MPSSVVTEAYPRSASDHEDMTYFQVLLHDDRNSYYIVSTDEGGTWTDRAVKRGQLPYLSFEDDANYYITHNGFTGKRRQMTRTRQLNTLFFDLDCHDASASECKSAIESAYGLIMEAVRTAALPNPSMIVNSGRGLHLYYVLERSVPYRFNGSGAVNEKGIELFKDVQSRVADILDEVLADESYINVDRAVFDYTRVARIPGTYNTKANCYAHLVYTSGVYHHLADLATYKPSKKRSQLQRAAGKAPIILHFNPLMVSRLNKVVELQEYRCFDCEGSRELMCFVYYNTAVQVYERDIAKMQLQSFNACFKKPLPAKEIDGIFNAVDSVVNVKGETGHYVLRAKKVADLLGLTEKEMEATNFFASKRVIERMAAKKRTKEKRESRNQRIVEIYKRGDMTQHEVAQAVGCSLRTVKNVLKDANLTRPRKAETATVEVVAALTVQQVPIERPEESTSLSWSSNQVEGCFSFAHKRANFCQPCLGVVQSQGMRRSDESAIQQDVESIRLSISRSGKNEKLFDEHDGNKELEWYYPIKFT